MRALAQAGATLLGATIGASRPLSGGDLSSLTLVDLQDGRRVVVKRGHAPRTEARMLQAIAATGAPAPAVLAVSDTVLVMAYVAACSFVGDAWGDMGRVLGTLHTTTGAAYGWPENYAFGSVAIANKTAETWPEFFARRRLLPFLPHLPASLAARIERLAGRLDRILPARPPASLLHGDLWGGNVLSAGGRVAALIDPACYFGHGEVDVAMLGLFDRPGPAFFEAYPLAPGSAPRLAAYSLWPALVHLRLFGAGYRPMVARFLTEAEG